MMKQYILDGCEINSIKEFHRIIKETLGFPDYYGNNLDALYDCLTEMQGKITIIHLGGMKEGLGDYFEPLVHVIEHAQEENPLLKIQFM